MPPLSGNSIADKLGNDGKLMPKEHQRCFDNDLCLNCGRTGHKSKDCKKAALSASKAKAHAAQAIEKDKEAPKKG